MKSIQIMTTGRYHCGITNNKSRECLNNCASFCFRIKGSDNKTPTRSRLRNTKSLSFDVVIALNRKVNVKLSVLCVNHIPSVLKSIFWY